MQQMLQMNPYQVAGTIVACAIVVAAGVVITCGRDHQFNLQDHQLKQCNHQI